MKRNQPQNQGLMITEGPIVSGLLTFFLPILLGAIFQQAYTTADAIVVGRFLGRNALAAVGGGSTMFITLLIGFFLGLTGGAGIVISQAYGAKQTEKVNEGIATSMTIAVIAGVITTVLGLTTSRLMMTLIGTPDEILDMATGYLNVYFLGMVPTLIYNMAATILRSMGDSSRPLYALMVSAVCNIALDIIFVPVLGFGVNATAWATVIAMSVSAVIMMGALAHPKEKQYRFTIRDFRIRKDVSRQMLMQGIPAAFQGSMYNISNLIIQSSINALGTTSIAGTAIYNKMDSFFWMTISSFGIAMTVFIGQNWGAGNLKRVKKITRIGFLFGTAISASFSLLLIFEGNVIMRLFTSDLQVLETGMSVCCTIAPFFLCWLPIEIYSAVIRGSGESIAPALISAFGVCVLRILWIRNVFPKSPSLTTIMEAYPVTWIITSAIFFIYYLSGGWKKRTPVYA